MTVVIERKRPTPEDDARRAPASAAAAARAKSTTQGLYKPRTPIYPKHVHGRWRTIKWALLAVTLGIYYVVPWIRWPRPPGAPQQAVLVDFAGRRFYFFFIQLWPQEVYFITGLLVMAALSLFLVTALFGRLWCGYACPQTVWTDLYMAVERLVEGDRNQRMRLDAAPWSAAKIGRKGVKHALWIAIAVATGGAWIFYFQDAPTLWKTLWTGQAPMTAYVSAGILTFTTYALAGTMREQVCTYMCPWPRIQGAMIDGHSLQVTYRRDRGEPRGPHKKGQSWGGRGDCVDCNACVVACPMGIDIRNGAQLECINCGLCIDACDEIMLRVERPKGLIAYDTDEAVAARAAGKPARYVPFRARTIYYGVALSIVSGLMIWGLATRSPVVFEVLRDRNPTFVRLDDGSVRNGYTLKIDNRSFEPRHFQVTLAGLPGETMQTPGAKPAGGPIDVTVAPNEVRAVRVLVKAPPASLGARSIPVVFAITQRASAWRAASTFLSADVTPP
ncbi:MAG TPA: cytochrome c oxidase accessory protein CcoG [Caulobacteraceae bacterium]|nr:cytochrome c oxidase accessory protein CcoG [Caulobacteraceae bacterium]